MKLIIDIPDKAYDILTEYQVLPENIDLEYFVIHGMPFDDVKVEIQNTILKQTYEKGQNDVLEKVKAEIDTLYGVYYSYFKERLVIKTDVMRILDEHISELKGEQE